MKGAASKVFIALGIILILAAILWWAIAVNALVKVPDDLNKTDNYEGNVTWYVDAATLVQLAEGSEMQIGLEVERKLTADKDQFDSSKGVINEDINMNMQPFQGSVITNAYALDRKTSKNVNDTRAYSWDPSNIVEREGTYYPILPFDTSKDQKYNIWQNDIGEGEIGRAHV